MDTKGGRFSLTISGKTFSGRAAAKIMPSTVAMATGVNQDGSAYNTVQPKLAGLDLSFDRGVGLLWDSTMMLKSIDVTFQEIDVAGGLTHLFTSASWDGDPTIDSATGEVTGLKILTASTNYQSYNG